MKPSLLTDFFNRSPNDMFSVTCQTSYGVIIQNLNLFNKLRFFEYSAKVILRSGKHLSGFRRYIRVGSLPVQNPFGSYPSLGM